MNIRLLIDCIMQQTTVLIGQLSTAAGVRAPLAHVADQVFVDLARELDQQGVAQRVAADMFGLALRSYQKKVRRLSESVSVPDKTLWQAVLEHIGANQRARRADVLQRFSADGEREVGAVLNDLVGSGLLYQTGYGGEALYGVTSEADLAYLLKADEARAAVPAVWAAVHREPGLTARALAERLSMSASSVSSAIDTLVREGKVEKDGPSDEARLRAVDLVVPVGAELGWEIAVFDHFRAVVNAIAAKVRRGRARSAGDDLVGGATLGFDVWDGHPFEQRVERLLIDARAEVGSLWNDVEAFNREHAAKRENARRVYFYFGQYVQDSEDDDG
jgi:DNA-binding Lrp family transcriptional regulator